MKKPDDQRNSALPPTPYPLIPKKVRLVFGHGSLTARWALAAERLREEGFDLLVCGQDASIDWEVFCRDEIAAADVVVAEISGHYANAGLIEAACAQAGWGRLAHQDRPAEQALEIARLRAYREAAGVDDLVAGVHFLLYAAGLREGLPPPPHPPLLLGIGLPGGGCADDLAAYRAWHAERFAACGGSIVALLYSRYAWLDADDAWLPIAIEQLAAQGLLAVPIFADWQLATTLAADDNPLAQLLASLPKLSAIWNGLISHAAGEMGSGTPFTRFGVPVFQLVRSYTQSAEAWREHPDGLAAMTVTYNMVQPEMLGTIEPLVFAGSRHEDNPAGPGSRMRCDPLPEQIGWLAERSAAWTTLRTKANADKRLAIFLHHGPCTSVEGTIATAAGLDAAESCVRLLRHLRDDGYEVHGIPADGAALRDLLMEKRAINEFRWTNTEMIVKRGGDLALIDEDTFRQRFDRLHAEDRAALDAAWGPFPAEAMVYERAGDPRLVVSGLRFGNIVVIIDPKRGCYGPKCDGEVCRILHEPDIPPPLHWLATYWWCQDQVDALVSLGTEWPMEYLPGKRAGLSTRCWAAISLGRLPLVYAYLCDAPGEALMARRRGQALLVDHLPAAVSMRGEEDEELAELLELHRQYEQATHATDRARRREVEQSLRAAATATGLLAAEADELAWQRLLPELPRRVRRLARRRCRHHAHVIGQAPEAEQCARYAAMLDCDAVPELAEAPVELERIVAALSAGFVPPGPSGSLLRGRRDVLPTGRNPYGLDLSRLPNQAAETVGEDLGRRLLTAHIKEEGRFPERIAITLWSSDAFQAEGELLAQILWLLGCRAQRDQHGKVCGVDIVDELGEIEGRARPRCDVVVQMSGVVRDTLPAVWNLIDQAVQAVAELDEPAERNRVRAARDGQLRALREELAGCDEAVLQRLASARVFSSKPGSFGTGVDLAVDAAAWENDQDLAEAFVNWTGFAYGAGLDGRHAGIDNAQALGSYARLMAGVDATYQKALGPEYDALSIGCYAAFQGGMSACVRGQGASKGPRAWWGATDDADGDKEVRSLENEIDQALLARFGGEAWLKDKREEGYRGAAEIAHTVNTLLRWSATARAVEGRHFDRVSERLLGDEAMRAWMSEANPYAMETVTRKLLEAESRGLWQADAEHLQLVQDAALQVEGDIEEAMGEVTGELQGSSIDVLRDDDVEKWKYDFFIGLGIRD